MKTAGWICLAIGVLSFIGAALKGNSVFGPLFWIGLGSFLLYRVNNKGKEGSTKPSTLENTSTIKPKIKDTIQDVPEINETVTECPNQQLESLKDIQGQLTLQQREAALCLISFFGGYIDNLMDNVPIFIFKQSALFFGLPDSPSELSRIMAKYTDADTVVDIILTIKPVKAKEFLLLTCYDLIKTSNKSEAYDLLLNIANDMGYDKDNFTKLIKRYQ